MVIIVAETIYILFIDVSKRKNNGVDDACATISVDDHFFSQINLYPNPSTGLINLVLPQDASVGKNKIMI